MITKLLFLEEYFAQFLVGTSVFLLPKTPLRKYKETKIANTTIKVITLLSILYN